MWFMYGLKGHTCETLVKKKVRGKINFYGLSYYIVIETYALKLSKSSALKFWMYAE